MRLNIKNDVMLNSLNTTQKICIHLCLYDEDLILTPKMLIELNVSTCTFVLVSM